MNGFAPFPATKETPGQAESRDAYKVFRASLADYPWAAEYRELVEAGYQWRVAVWMLWYATPKKLRTPETQGELATQVLGLANDQAIRKWKVTQPGIMERIALLQAGPLMEHRADVIQATIDNALTADGHQDRKLFFTLTGDIGADVDVNVNVKVKGYVGVSPDDWDTDEFNPPDTLPAGQ